MSEATRICEYCKQPINVEYYNDTFVIHGTRFAHVDCFIKYKISLKRNALTFEEAEEEVKNLKEFTKQNLSSRTIIRKLTDFIMETYDFISIPSAFYTKLNTIINGTHPKVTRPVPAEDLLDMWQRKVNYLNKLHLRLEDKGKDIKDISRVYYDMAVLLGQYNSYLDWKHSQEEEKQKLKQSIKDQIEKNNCQVIKNKNIEIKQNTKFDIVDILDEI